jgi:hypothetical protein
MYENREYIIFPITELPKIDFTQVLETSEDTVRKSVDQTKTFVKWSSEQPACTLSLTNSEGPYTHEEILVILSTPEWSSPIEII